MAPREEHLLPTGDSKDNLQDTSESNDDAVLSSSSSPSSTTESPILATSRHLLQPNGSIIGRDVAQAILPYFPTFASAIPSSSTTPALACIDGRQALSHYRVVEFIQSEFGPALHQLGFGQGDRIALVLPNGPELATALVAVAHWATAVPLNANGATSELEADLLRCGADLVIGPYWQGLTMTTTKTLQGEELLSSPDERFSIPSAVGGNGNNCDWSAFESIQRSAEKLCIPYCGLVPSPNEAGVFRLQPPLQHSPVPLLRYADTPMEPLTPLRDVVNTFDNPVNTAPNTHDSQVLVLFTSGTTGNKKLVPHLLGDMLVAATTIALSWDLTPQDVNCNLMPLFHVGGIVRQIFSPLLSGGCVICCPAFDPNMFWALLQKGAFSWYYAAPTMSVVVVVLLQSSVRLPLTTLFTRLDPFPCFSVHTGIN